MKDLYKKSYSIYGMMYSKIMNLIMKFLMMKKILKDKNAS